MNCRIRLSALSLLRPLRSHCEITAPVATILVTLFWGVTMTEQLL